MKILIFTQIVDSEDHFLGFFHKWIEEFSKYFDEVLVVCLKKGKYSLPKNVRVLSLGKESGVSKFKYIINFYRYIFFEKNKYDKVFVHMNQEYILLGGVIWKILGKDIFMWRNHYSGNLITDFVSLFCKKIFCTSKYSYTYKYKKTRIMPVGVDDSLFKDTSNISRIKNSILSFGRISPSKNIHILIEAFNILKNKGFDFTANIYGDALPKDIGYLNMLKSKVKEYSLDGVVKFYNGVPHHLAPDLYFSHEIFVNPSKSGMYDKMIFESMLSGCLVLSSNEDLKDHIDNKFIFTYNNPNSIADKISMVLSLNDKEKMDTTSSSRSFALRNNLNNLVSSLSKEINSI